MPIYSYISNYNMSFYIHNYLPMCTHIWLGTRMSGRPVCKGQRLLPVQSSPGGRWLRGGSPFPCVWGCVCTWGCARVCTPVCVQDADKCWFALVLPFGSRAAVPGCGHIRAALVQSGGSTMGELSQGPSPNLLSSLLASHPVPMGRRAEPPVPGRGHVGRARAQPPAK